MKFRVYFSSRREICENLDDFFFFMQGTPVPNFMVIRQTIFTSDQITMNQYTFQRVESFTYFAPVVTADNDASVEINARLVTANKTCYGLQRHLESKILCRITKMTLYI